MPLSRNDVLPHCVTSIHSGAQMSLTRTNVHVVPHRNGWGVRRDDAIRCSAVRQRQGDAVTLARRLAQRAEVELLIHDDDGTIRSRDSYAIAPHPPTD